jgi:hypothetical protein
MKVNIQETKENFEILQAMASKDRETAIAAQEAFASLIQPTSMTARALIWARCRCCRWTPTLT